MPCRVSSSYGAGAGCARSCAATSWWQQGAASTQRACQRTARASASSVAVSQACSASTRSGAGSTTASAIVPATKRTRSPQPSRCGQLGVALPLVLAHVHPDQLDVEPACGEVAVRGERQVRVAAAQIHHAQRAGQVVGQGRGQRAQEGVHLAALRRRAADLGEDRVARVEQVLLLPVVPARRRRRPGSPRPGAPAPRRTWSPAVAASRRPSPRASCRTARPAARRPPRPPPGRARRCGCTAGRRRRWRSAAGGRP